MNIEDIFKWGVTPKSGPGVGKRFRVEAISGNGELKTREWDSEKFGPVLSSGEYRVWEAPKTVFDDSAMIVTWGELKRGMEQKGFGDDTRLYVKDWCSIGVSLAHANVGVAEINGEKVVFFY